MRGERGFSFVEVMILVALLAGVIGTVSAVAQGLQRTDRTTGAYVEDVSGLRRAVRAVEDDARRARALDELRWELGEDGVLRRGGQPFARNIGVFSLEEEGPGPLVRVVIGLRPRRDVPPANVPRIVTAVCMRGR